MSDNIIRLNSGRTTEFEFEVTIQGIAVDSPEEMAQVRFTIIGGGEKHPYCLTFSCSRIPDTSNKWLVKFPVLNMLNKDKAYEFRIEVIVDGYYFEPAGGNVMFVTNPQVDLTKPVSKPKVTALFSQSKDDDEEKKEEEPKEEKKKDEVKSKEDEEITIVEPVQNKKDEEQEARDNATEIAKMTYQKDTPKEPAPTISFGVKNEELTPQQIAKKILFEKKEPTKDERPGFLFPKGKDGKKKVRGLLTEQEKQEAEEKNKKLKKILKEVKPNGKK